MIRIVASNRAAVKDDFKELLVLVARGQVETIKRESERYPGRRMSTLKLAASMLRNANAILKDMDGIVTRLRLLNGYSVLDTFRYKNRNYFHARTKAVAVNDGGKHQVQAENPKLGYVLVDNPPCWDLGEYDVYVPADIFSVRNLNHFQFVPVRAPLDGHRHPHHHAKYIEPGHNGEDWNEWYTAQYVDPRTEHPLDLFAKTCWGGFNTIIANNLSEMDVVEVFRTIWVYLNRHNPGSPLLDMNEITFKLPYRGVAL
jgi:hypothetical protein